MPDSRIVSLYVGRQLQRWHTAAGRGNLFTPKLWLERCRLWRLILLQADDGYWEPTYGLSFALLAHKTRPPRQRASDKKQGQVGLVAMVGAMLAGGGDELDADDLDKVVGDHNAADYGGGDESEQCPVTGSLASLCARSGGGTSSFFPAFEPPCMPPDCITSRPLRIELSSAEARCSDAGYSQEAIAWSVPERLKWAAQAPGFEPVPVERIWATELACATLKGINEHFLLQARRRAPSARPSNCSSGGVRSVLCNMLSIMLPPHATSAPPYARKLLPHDLPHDPQARSTKHSSFDETVMDRAMDYLDDLAACHEPLATGAHPTQPLVAPSAPQGRCGFLTLSRAKQR